MTPRAKAATEHVALRMQYFGHAIGPQHMQRGSGRQTEKSALRALVWWRLKDMHPNMSLGQIGQETGGWHHTSVLHGIREAPRWHAWIQGKTLKDDTQ